MMFFDSIFPKHNLMSREGKILPQNISAFCFSTVASDAEEAPLDLFTFDKPAKASFSLFCLMETVFQLIYILWCSERQRRDERFYSGFLTKWHEVEIST
jgi:hypothetical protein